MASRRRYSVALGSGVASRRRQLSSVAGVVPPPGSAYEALILSDGPALYWRLGEASGVIAVDISGNGRDGGYVGGPTLGVAGAIAGDSDTAVTLNGVDEYVFTNAAPATGDVFSLECWVKPDSFTAHGPLFAGGSGAFVFFIVQTAGTLRITDSTVSFIDVVSSVALIPGVWQHVVYTKNGTDRHVYLNGVDVTTPVSNQTFVSTATVTMGTAFGQYLAGSLDEAAIWTRALTPAEVLEHYETGAGI